MAKIKVTLRCQMDSGKEVKHPGEEILLEEAEARKLAAMHMVELPCETQEAKPGKTPGKKKTGKVVAPVDPLEPSSVAPSSVDSGADPSDPDGTDDGQDEGE